MLLNIKRDIRLKAQCPHKVFEPFHKALYKDTHSVSGYTLIMFRCNRVRWLRLLLLLSLLALLGLLLLLLLFLLFLRCCVEEIKEGAFVLAEAAAVVEKPVERTYGLLGNVLWDAVFIARGLCNSVLAGQFVVEGEEAADPRLEGLGAALRRDVVPELESAEGLELTVRVHRLFERAEGDVEVHKGQQLLPRKGACVVAVQLVDDPQVLQVQRVVPRRDDLEKLVQRHIVPGVVGGLPLCCGLVHVVQYLVDILFVRLR